MNLYRGENLVIQRLIKAIDNGLVKKGKNQACYYIRHWIKQEGQFCYRISHDTYQDKNTWQRTEEWRVKNPSGITRELIRLINSWQTGIDLEIGGI